MRFRKLRIAFSAVYGVLCLLLVVVWVRSYWFEDSVGRFSTSGRVIVMHSCKGQCQVYVTNYNPVRNAAEWFWTAISAEGRSLDRGFYYRRWASGALPDGWTVAVPQYLLQVIALAAAAMPWIRWSRRFSLRTLLIATTLLAVVFGLLTASITL